MPEPYRTDVRERADSITREVAPVVGEIDTQLCPRTILPDERVFDSPDSVIYGSVVAELHHGDKSVLYSSLLPDASRGMAVFSTKAAEAFAELEFRQGNRVQVKDASESDGMGQETVETLDELREALVAINDLPGRGAVIMPYFDQIHDRFSVGLIDLGSAGTFRYIGRENITLHEGREVYGGSDLAVYQDSGERVIKLASEVLQIPEQIRSRGLDAIERYRNLALETGRISVDIIRGIADNGERLEETVDVTARIGGATPAEVLAIREVADRPMAVAFARSRLLYAPEQRPVNGTNFVDTDSLIINAEVTKVEGVR